MVQRTLYKGGRNISPHKSDGPIRGGKNRINKVKIKLSSQE